MPPKRKANTLDAGTANPTNDEEKIKTESTRAPKRPRVSKATKVAAQTEDASASTKVEEKPGKVDQPQASSSSTTPKSWRDVALEGEDDDVRCLCLELLLRH